MPTPKEKTIPTAVRIAGRLVGPSAPPLVVAELSANHNGSLERALAIVDAAAGAGAHAIKLQTYTADSMTLDEDAPAFRIEDPKSLWAGDSLHKLYSDAATPYEWHATLYERAHQRGMIAFSSPFDAAAVDFLEELDTPCYKIASFEIIDLPLIRKAASTGKPVIFSTGMATAEEIGEAVGAARDVGSGAIVLLQCTSSYPAPIEGANLRTIERLRSDYDCEVGLSDHTPGSAVAVAATALGAVLIEKHVTLARADGGLDSAFSLEPHELATLVRESEQAWRALGEACYGPTEAERGSLQFRRSLYVVKDLRAGETITADHIRAIRPSGGLAPKHYDEVLGRRAAGDAPRGTALSWELVER